MEAARKSQPRLAANGHTPGAGAPEVPAAAKLTIEKFADGAISCLKFNGTITTTGVVTLGVQSRLITRTTTPG